MTDDTSEKTSSTSDKMVKTSEPTRDQASNDEALARLLEEGALQNESFMREDFAHQRQKAFFVCSALVIFSVVLLIVVGTSGQLQIKPLIAAISPMVLAGGLVNRWCRCPKCKTLPVHPASLIHQRSARFPKSCPHCGFVFDEELAQLTTDHKDTKALDTQSDNPA